MTNYENIEDTLKKNYTKDRSSSNELKDLKQETDESVSVLTKELESFRRIF